MYRVVNYMLSKQMSWVQLQDKALILVANVGTPGVPGNANFSPVFIAKSSSSKI